MLQNLFLLNVQVEVYWYRPLALPYTMNYNTNRNNMYHELNTIGKNMGNNSFIKVYSIRHELGVERESL